MVFFIYFVMLHYILVIYYNLKKKKYEPCIAVRDTLTAFAIGPREILHDTRLVWKHENNVNTLFGVLIIKVI